MTTNTASCEIIDLYTARQGTALLNIINYLMAQQDAENIRLTDSNYEEWDIYNLYDAMVDGAGRYFDANPYELDGRNYSLQSDAIYHIDEQGYLGNVAFTFGAAA